jgi:hypothetical protein
MIKNKFEQGTPWINNKDQLNISKAKHEYGSGIANYHRKVVYYNIPKCASTWMKEFMERLPRNASNPGLDALVSVNFIKTENIVDLTSIVILRDPVKRFLSSCYYIDSELLKNKENMFSDDSLLERLLEDEHQNPQFNFLTDEILENAVFFYCDENLTKNVSHYFEQTDILPYLNVTDRTNPRTNSIIEEFESLFSNDFFYKSFKSVFRKDYELINRVKFYGT